MANRFGRYAKKTRRAEFLEEMKLVVPWAELVAQVDPHDLQAGNGRRLVGVGRMLRIYFLQPWRHLSDPVAEEALCDSPLMREFLGRDLVRLRVQVERLFQIMKLKFKSKFVKVRYRGLGKNANRLFATCAVVNLFTARWTALRQEFA